MTTKLIAFTVFFALAVASALADNTPCVEVGSSSFPLEFSSGTKACITLNETVMWNAPSAFSAMVEVSEGTKLEVFFAGHSVLTTPGSRGFRVAGSGSRLLFRDFVNMSTTAQTSATFSRAIQTQFDGKFEVMEGGLLTNYTSALVSFDGVVEAYNVDIVGHMLASEPNQQLLGGLFYTEKKTKIVGGSINFYTAENATLQGQNWALYADSSIFSGKQGKHEWRGISATAMICFDYHDSQTSTLYDSTCTGNAPIGSLGRGVVAGLVASAQSPGTMTSRNVSLDMTGSNPYTTTGVFVRSARTVTMQDLVITGTTSREADMLLGEQFTSALFHVEPVHVPDTQANYAQTVFVSGFTFTSVGNQTIAIDVMPNQHYRFPYGIFVEDNKASVQFSDGHVRGDGLVGFYSSVAATNVDFKDVTIDGHWYGALLANGSTNVGVTKSHISNACVGVQLDANTTYGGRLYIAADNKVKNTEFVGCDVAIIDKALDTKTNGNTEAGASIRDDCDIVPEVADPTRFSDGEPAAKRQEFDPEADHDSNTPWRVAFV